VRDAVGDDMTAIVKAQVAIAQGKRPQHYEGPLPKPSDITKAAEFIRDTGWHKPSQVPDLGDVVPSGVLDFTKCTNSELDEMIAATERAEDLSDVEADDVPAPPPG
jgi:hypothetical protein